MSLKMPLVFKKHQNLSTKNAPLAITGAIITYMNRCQTSAYTEVIYVLVNSK